MAGAGYSSAVAAAAGAAFFSSKILTTFLLASTSAAGPASSSSALATAASTRAAPSASAVALSLNRSFTSLSASSSTSSFSSSSPSSSSSSSSCSASHHLSSSVNTNRALPQRLGSSPISPKFLKRDQQRQQVVAMSSSDAAASIPKVEKSDSEWRTVLSPEQFRILRQKGTEYPSTGKYDKFYEDGVYECAACKTPLYKSATKFKSGCGWPAFYEGLPGAITETPDVDGRRVEITCTACGGHLGHNFRGEGFSTPTDERHCVNSISLKFTPAEKK